MQAELLFENERLAVRLETAVTSSANKIDTQSVADLTLNYLQSLLEVRTVGKFDRQPCHCLLGCVMHKQR